jgi:hypothetical protein
VRRGAPPQPRATSGVGGGSLPVKEGEGSGRRRWGGKGRQAGMVGL